MADGRNTAYRAAKPWLDDGDLRLYHGDVLTVLRTLPAGIAQTCVTSPPYWGLRDYGTGTWQGGDADCDHVKPNRNAETTTMTGGTDTLDSRHFYSDVCGKCGAQRIDDQLGLEATPDEYVERMVEVFREVRRVLRDDGTLWLNIGDSYAGSTMQGGTGAGSLRPNGATPHTASKDGADIRFDRQLEHGLKPKDLVGIPWRLAFALQTDGWYLRSDIIWAKPNPMPESVTDRPTKAHEYVFLFSKQPRYFYDADAVREPQQTPATGYEGRQPPPNKGEGRGLTRAGNRAADGWIPNGHNNPAGRNLRSVWQIATQPFPEAHFATYPEELVRRCILAGTSERGGCANCGSPWIRKIQRIAKPALEKAASEHQPNAFSRSAPRGGGNGAWKKWRDANPDRPLGWEPTCMCPHQDVMPQLVLDPFIGSGTTALVARKHGRHSIGIDLSAEYLEIAARRTSQLSLLGAAR